MDWRQQPFINGQYVEGAGHLNVIDPSTEEIVGQVETASANQFEAAILAARDAYDRRTWSDIPVAERIAALGRLIDFLDSKKEMLRQAIVAEAGCPIGSQVMFAQLDGPLVHARQVLEFYASLPSVEDNPLPLAERINASGLVVQSVREYRPLGVVAAITAYNFPFYTNIWKVIPALVSGNTVVLRPNPLTPFSATVFGEASLAAGLPPGVLNVVIEQGAEGAVMLSTHQAVDMVAFTGSSAVGSMVMAQAAPTMKRLQLELGGKSAQIFLPDSVDAAPQGPLMTCLAHAGQGCVLPTRILVPQESKSAILKAMASALEVIKVGDTRDKSTQMGPVISAAQRERCERFVGLAVKAGGTIATGGARPGHLKKGFFFQPTVIDVADNDNPAARNEIFGPVVTVMGYRDLDHAVSLANDSPFGLSGYVVGKDKKAALGVASRLRTGTVNVNAGVFSAYASSGGWGLSGIGRERGIEGIRVYQNIRCMNIG